MIEPIHEPFQFFMFHQSGIWGFNKDETKYYTKTRNKKQKKNWAISNPNVQYNRFNEEKKSSSFLTYSSDFRVKIQFTWNSNSFTWIWRQKINTRTHPIIITDSFVDFVFDWSSHATKHQLNSKATNNSHSRLNWKHTHTLTLY